MKELSLPLQPMIRDLFFEGERRMRFNMFFTDMYGLELYQPKQIVRFISLPEEARFTKRDLQYFRKLERSTVRVRSINLIKRLKHR